MFPLHSIGAKNFQKKQCKQAKNGRHKKKSPSKLSTFCYTFNFKTPKKRKEKKAFVLGQRTI